MMQIPKNVMQIGEVNAHTKIYMEDYVHTFLERRTKPEEYLVFGKKEELSDVLYYFIYGVEKKTDWDRGSYPYFKQHDRIGTMEGTAGKLIFKPVRGAGIRLDGYFIFYEQNEDMQSYMIVVQEAENIAGNEEKEAVMEAVRMHKEQRQKELEAAQARPERHIEGEDRQEKKEAAGRSGRRWTAFQTALPRESIVHTLQRKAKKNTALLFGKGTAEKKERQSRFSFGRRSVHSLSIPDLCRGGSMLLLLLLVVMGLTSLNRYPDMKAVLNLFSDAAKKTEEENASQQQEGGLIVEEATIGQEESALVAEAVIDETETGGEPVLAEDGKIQWMIGEQTAQSGQKETTLQEEKAQKQSSTWEDAEESSQESGMQETASQQTGEAAQTESDTTAQTEETALAEQETEEENATQALARPVSYVVKKGDSLAGIARKFYGNASMVHEICQVNQIENPDQIHPGQNILLP